MTKPPPEEQLRLILSSRTNAFTKKKLRKTVRVTEDWIGCSWIDLKGQIESQFTDGMDWENQGFGWHVDHRISLFWAQSVTEVRILSNHRNLRPMWSWDNCKRGIGGGDELWSRNGKKANLANPVVVEFLAARARRGGLSSNECFTAMMKFLGITSESDGKDFQWIEKRVSGIPIEELRKLLAGAIAHDCREE